MNKRIIALVPFGEAHIEQTFEWVSCPKFQRAFMLREPPTREKNRAYFERALRDPTQRVYAIMSDSRHVGNAGFKHLDGDARIAGLWIYIGSASDHGRGLGRLAAQELVREGFGTLGLDRIYLHVAEFNRAARKMYAHLGFVEVPLPDAETEWKNRECVVIRMELKRADAPSLAGLNESGS